MIYCVEGRTGEGDDRTTWLVGGSLEREKALDLCDRLNEWCAANGYATNNEDRPCNMVVCPEDPGFVCDYTGTRYRVIAIPVIQ